MLLLFTTLTIDDIAMNIDQAEINKFAELASRWWDKEGECKPLHEINPLRMQFMQNHVSLSGKKVLDVGCGGGILSESLAKAGATVSAIDLAEASLEVAKLHLLESKLNIDYQCTTVEDFASKNTGAFDMVACMEMLEHVPDPGSVIHACATLLKPGGDFFVSTLNRNVKSFIQAIVGAEYVLGLLPKGTHQYGRFIKPGELIGTARKVGLRCEHKTGLTYHPIRKTYALVNNIDVNYVLHFRKYH